MSTCETCRHMHNIEAANPEKKTPPRNACRRFPPTIAFLIVPRAPSRLQPEALVPVEEQRSGFPMVMADWSCGEWVPKVELVS